MQVLRRIKLSVEEYVRQAFHKQMRAPDSCPNCARLHRFWAHGYYERYGTDKDGKPVAFYVRRFLCTFCRLSTSCLPCFAQPYRLISHATLDAFLAACDQRRDVQAQLELLKRYERSFAKWKPSLLRIIGNYFGRASPKEEATAFWRKAVAACGSVSDLTIQLVEKFRTTCFGTYRCHQPRHAR